MTKLIKIIVAEKIDKKKELNSNNGFLWFKRQPDSGQLQIATALLASLAGNASLKKARDGYKVYETVGLEVTETGAYKEIKKPSQPMTWQEAKRQAQPNFIY